MSARPARAAHVSPPEARTWASAHAARGGGPPECGRALYAAAGDRSAHSLFQSGPAPALLGRRSRRLLGGGPDRVQRSTPPPSTPAWSMTDAQEPPWAR